MKLISLIKLYDHNATIKVEEPDKVLYFGNTVLYNGLTEFLPKELRHRRVKHFTYEFGDLLIELKEKN